MKSIPSCVSLTSIALCLLSSLLLCFFSADDKRFWDMPSLEGVTMNSTVNGFDFESSLLTDQPGEDDCSWLNSISVSVPGSNTFFPPMGECN